MTESELCTGSPLFLGRDHCAQLRGGASASPRLPVAEQELSSHQMYMPNCCSKKAGWKCSVPSIELGCPVPCSGSFNHKQMLGQEIDAFASR